MFQRFMDWMLYQALNGTGLDVLVIAVSTASAIAGLTFLLA